MTQKVTGETKNYHIFPLSPGLFSFVVGLHFRFKSQAYCLSRFVSFRPHLNDYSLRRGMSAAMPVCISHPVLSNLEDCSFDIVTFERLPSVTTCKSFLLSFQQGVTTFIPFLGGHGGGGEISAYSLKAALSCFPSATL